MRHLAFLTVFCLAFLTSTFTATASSLTFPPLTDMEGLVIHNTASSSPFSLHMGSVSNCVDSAQISKCDLEDTSLKLGDSNINLTKMNYVDPSSQNGTKIYNLFGKIVFSSIHISAERSILVSILIEKDGTKRGYVRVNDFDLTEQVVF